MFELIINRVAKRIELVIVHLYCESENNIYLMRNKCLCVFGEITMPGKTSQPTQEDHRAMAAATEGVRQVVGCEFSYIERE